MIIYFTGANKCVAFATFLNPFKTNGIFHKVWYSLIRMIYYEGLDGGELVFTIH